MPEHRVQRSKRAQGIRVTGKIINSSIGLFLYIPQGMDSFLMLSYNRVP